MAAVTEARGITDVMRAASTPKVAVEGRKAKPVKWWAAVGAGFLVLQIYIYAAWILSGPERTPAGDSPIEGWMLFLVRAQEVACPIGLVLFLYFFLYKPIRRDGRVSLDGIFCLCMLGLYWMDPMVNYTASFATYNAHFFNLGSWTEQVPGWMSPNGGNFAEPLLWAGPTYVWALFGGVLISNRVMRKAKERWPQLGTAGLIGVCLAFFFVADMVLEMLFMRIGIYTYAGSLRSVSFFGGHYYQFPIYEALLWGATWAGFACVRYFQNDKGQTVAERGIDEVRATPKQKTMIRGLAVLGMLSSIFMAYNITWAWFSLNQDEWPADIQGRSYFTDQLCGPGTDYICPGPDVPNPRPDSSHVNPEGELVPAGD